MCLVYAWCKTASSQSFSVGQENGAFSVGSSVQVVQPNDEGLSDNLSHARWATCKTLCLHCMDCLSSSLHPKHKASTRTPLQEPISHIIVINLCFHNPTYCNPYRHLGRSPYRARLDLGANLPGPNPKPSTSKPAFRLPGFMVLGFRALGLYGFGVSGLGFRVGVSGLCGFGVSGFSNTTSLTLGRESRISTNPPFRSQISIPQP